MRTKTAVARALSVSFMADLEKRLLMICPKAGCNATCASGLKYNKYEENEEALRHNHNRWSICNWLRYQIDSILAWSLVPTTVAPRFCDMARGQ